MTENAAAGTTLPARPTTYAPLAVAALVGHPRAGSRTEKAALTVADAIVDALNTAGVLAERGTDLIGAEVAADVFGPASQAVAARVDRVADADIVVVTTPTFRGAYTGLLKALLDLSGRDSWVSTVAVPFQVVGAPGHTLAADLHLRPLLLELGATTPTAALVAEDSWFADGTFEARLGAWVEQALPVLAAVAHALPRAGRTSR